MPTARELNSPIGEADTPHDLLAELKGIRVDLDTAMATWPSRLQATGPHRPSAENLVHYLALRARDLRSLQAPLAALGLSSLGRAEPHVLATLDAVITALDGLSQAPQPMLTAGRALDFAGGEQLIVDHTSELFGSPTPGRHVRIMVTMPSEAADDAQLVLDLVRSGMNCMRINCAHDDEAMWTRMIENLRRAEREVGVRCRILMDLAGPKLRTGPVAPGPCVVRVRPRRDALGAVVTPAHVWLTAETNPSPAPPDADAVIPVPDAWIAQLRPGQSVHLRDARGSRRTLHIIEGVEGGALAALKKTAYIVPGTELRIEADGPRTDRTARVGPLPAIESPLSLRRGDELILTRDQTPGQNAWMGLGGDVMTSARIGCTLGDVFDDIRPGDAIWFDDGRIGGVVEDVAGEDARVRITQTCDGPVELGSDKGINLPDSAIRTSALTPKDLRDLEFITRHADIVALSFANSARDVRRLHDEMARLGGHQPDVVLKIETRRGFERLPEMLLEAMRRPRCGVMIARGDLAVEMGFDRLAEVQEEILWICEAAHIPAIWATQVLESLAKRGMPSRAEITDAAMGNRAECVMLNKGPHVVDAVRTLDSILRRMQAHQNKKRSMLRGLKLAISRPDEGDAA